MSETTSMFRVPGTPWDYLGTKLQTTTLTSESIIKEAKLDFTCSCHTMFDDLSSSVQNYHSIYRDDNKELLGVVNKSDPQIVQNIDSFKLMEYLLQKNLITAETAASYQHGKSVFCVFPVMQEYKVLDDNVKLYFIVVNDHLKPDGKVLILNTPIRIVCQNALSYALDKSMYSVRMPVPQNVEQLEYLSNQLMKSLDTTIIQLNSRCNTLVQQKVSKVGLEKVYDTLFPYFEEKDFEHRKANDSVQRMRDTLDECLAAEDLSNYTGTVYWLYNGLIDFIQHYHTKMSKLYDLEYKMSLVPGFVSTDSKLQWINTTLKLKSSLDI